MFLGLLSDEEKRAFVTLAEMLIEADGIVVGSEMDALEVLRREMAVPVLAEARQPDVEELVAVFSSRRSRVVALLELLGLGYSDAEFNADEKSLVTVIAHEMDISADDLACLETWVKDHVALIEAALEMMRES